MQNARGVPQPADDAPEATGLRWSGFDLAILSDPDIVFVPTERVRLAVVALPLKRADQRKASLPFAMEALLGEPIEQCHFAIGERLGDDRYLACALNAGQMATWTARIETAGDRAMIVPDVLVLPRPPEGVWHVAELGDRALVRLPDGSGFATVLSLLPVFAEAEGFPECRTVLGSEGALSSAASLAWPDRSELLNLRQGSFAASASRTARRQHLVVLGALAMVALASVMAGADVMALQHIAHTREARLISAFRERFPDTPPGTALLAAIEALDSPGPGQHPDPFLSVLSETSLALQDAPSVAVQDLAFTQTSRRLDLNLETDSLDTFQSLGSRLKQSGITAELGAATVVPGGAEGRLSVTAKDQPQ